MILQLMIDLMLEGINYAKFKANVLKINNIKLRALSTFVF